jgi:hypothetical protein
VGTPGGVLPRVRKYAVPDSGFYEGIRYAARRAVVSVVVCDDVVGLIFLPYYAAAIGLDSVDEEGALG